MVVVNKGDSLVMAPSSFSPTPSHAFQLVQLPCPRGGAKISDGTP